MKVFFKFFMFLCFAVALSAHASRDVIETSFKGTSEKPAAQARQEIFQDAIEKVSKQFIQQIIGETKYNQNESTIKNKIIRESGKYVLFVKSLDTKSTASGTEMTVGMKLSLQSLQQLLLKEGLLYKMSGSPKVIPLIQIQDRVAGASYSWWVESLNKSSGTLSSPLAILHQSLREGLMPLGFYFLNPIHPGFSAALPTVFQSESLPTDDELVVGEFFDGQIVISGGVLLKQGRKRADAYEIEVRLTARHTGNGRVVGEVIRTYETEAGPMARMIGDKAKEVFPDIAKDLTVQIHDAWKSGTFGSTLIRLVINGDFNFLKLNQFKNQLLTQVHGVKTLKERKFMPGQVVFEIDSDTTAEQISQSIQKTQFSQFSVQVSSGGVSEIELSVSSTQ
jgi:hypothetical protein